jgi:hypothetical protein
MQLYLTDRVVAALLTPREHLGLHLISSSLISDLRSLPTLCCALCCTLYDIHLLLYPLLHKKNFPLNSEAWMHLPQMHVMIDPSDKRQEKWAWAAKGLLGSKRHICMTWCDEYTINVHLWLCWHHDGTMNTWCFTVSPSHTPTCCPYQAF